MRIISDYKDYYDCMLAHDTDPEPMLIRKSQKDPTILRKFDYPLITKHLEKASLYVSCGIFSSKSGRIEFSAYAIFFAGKFYPIYHGNVYDRGYYNKRKIFVYDVDNTLQLIDKYKGGSWHKEGVKRFFQFFAQENADLSKIAQEYGPIFGLSFSWNKGEFILSLEKNIALKDFCFEKILPPAEAYNELWKAVCNMQRPAMSIPEMDNQTKIHLAGFDTKTSFRKAKQ